MRAHTPPLSPPPPPSPLYACRHPPALTAPTALTSWQFLNIESIYRLPMRAHSPPPLSPH